MRLATSIALLLILSAPLAAQAPMGISASELGSATKATVDVVSSSTSARQTGVSYLAWSCGNNGNCTFFDLPLTGTATRHTVIFGVGDWRIAAYCDARGGIESPYDASAWVSVFEPCAGTRFPDRGAWIEIRKNGADLSVLFPGKKPPKDAEKEMHGHWRLNILYHILSVHNVKTGETWPKTLEQLMEK